MFILYILLLLTFALIAPALAFFPSLVFSSARIAVIPILSAFIVFLLKNLLVTFNLFTQQILLSISIALLIVAIVRIYIVKKYLGKIYLNKNQIIIILFLSVLMLPFFVNMGLDSFSSHAEIYSWNMWAVQHYLGEPIDFYYTKSPYPQLYPSFLAYCYKMLGSIELQMPVRCLLVIFPLSMLIMIATANKIINRQKLILTLLVLLLLVFGAEIHDEFKRGLADPIMASSLIISVALFIYYRSNNDISLLWLSLICGLASAYTKQPALIWSCFAFPAILIFKIIWNKFFKNNPPEKTFQVLMIAIFSLMGSLYWMFTQGRNFQENRGVIHRSLEGRGFFEQILFSCYEYFIKNPIIFLFILGAFIAVHKAKRNRDIFWLLLLPSLLAWFIWGAYDVRLGMHVTSLAALLIISADFYGIPLLRENSILLKKPISVIDKHWKKVSASFVSICIFFACIYVYQAKTDEQTQLNLYSGGKNTIEKYFGSLSDYVYKNLYNNSDLTLWVPSHHIYGIFYGHTTMIRPHYSKKKDYNEKSVLNEILTSKPDYAFYARELSYGPGSKMLRRLIDKCPDLFKKISSADRPDNDVQVYKIKKENINKQKCLNNLRSNRIVTGF